MLLRLPFARSSDEKVGDEKFVTVLLLVVTWYQGIKYRTGGYPPKSNELIPRMMVLENVSPFKYGYFGYPAVSFRGCNYMC